MKQTAQNPKPQPQKKSKKGGFSSTQAFIEIEEIREHYVILKGGNACAVIEVQATNFALLSEEEQRVKLLSYASLLNSLSFTVQIVVQSKRIDITSYIKSLEQQAHNIPFPTIDPTQRQKISEFILKYKTFVEEMTRTNTVLDKKFYLIIPYAQLEQGATGALKKSDVFEQAKASLKVKADSLLKEILHLSLKAKLLGQEELVALFYQVFNPGTVSAHMGQTENPIVVEGKREGAA